ncbi:glycosyltransferase [Altibacter sp. HG106]|uniref:glycosyltransferase n=1 Tax=Altibacter sp. HG106 TaxID=3023937 RepID=UPI002350F19C|nr:glycosyltransferase [Altibacter sp. HG106]MDC7994069.1 glycosyltransferase [Altibacter sp. HG106]
MIAVSIGITAAYLVLLLWILWGYFRCESVPDVLTDGPPPKTLFTVIVPYRNEIEHLPSLLGSLKNLEYPHSMFEIIFMDDASDDGSTELIETMLASIPIPSRIEKTPSHTGSPKKDAISHAVQLAEFDWIVTTDADCVVPKYWLRAFDAYLQNHSVQLLAGPVFIKGKQNRREQFQTWDGISLQALTMAGFGNKTPLLCNGANLAYAKNAFLQVAGYHGNTHIASGDDVFLLEKMTTQFPGQTAYLKSPQAIVNTAAEEQWSHIIEQRIRWASKTSKQKNWRNPLIGGIVFLANLWFLLGLLLSLLFSELFKYYLVFAILKVLLDPIILWTCAHFFRKRLSISYYLWSALFYPFVTLWVVFKSTTSGYQWKGRRFNT